MLFTGFEPATFRARRGNIIFFDTNLFFYFIFAAPTLAIHASSLKVLKPTKKRVAAWELKHSDGEM